MNKAHRDRIAFIRICSGKFERGMDVFHVQGGKKVKLAQGTQLMASEREIVEEAYAGDIIGVFDPGIFSIGDTLTTAKTPFAFAGIPTFAPEHFSRVSQVDTMKRKQFVKGMEQIAQEGAIQIFKELGGGMEEVIVGVVGVPPVAGPPRCWSTASRTNTMWISACRTCRTALSGGSRTRTATPRR